MLADLIITEISNRNSFSTGDANENLVGVNGLQFNPILFNSIGSGTFEIIIAWCKIYRVLLRNEIKDYLVLES